MSTATADNFCKLHSRFKVGPKHVCLKCEEERDADFYFHRDCIAVAETEERPYTDLLTRITHYFSIENVWKLEDASMSTATVKKM